MSNWLKDLFEETDGLSAAQNDIFRDAAKERLTENSLIDFVKGGVFDRFFTSIAAYDDAYKDKSGLAFTDAERFLKLVYKIYLKHPELHLDQELEKGLIQSFQSQYDGIYYAGINTLDQQLTNEAKGISPFTIDNHEVFVAFRVSMIRREDFLLHRDIYKGKLYENNLYGFAEEIDDKIKEIKGY